MGVRADTSEPTDEKQPPIFCLRWLQKGFSTSDCTTDEKAALAERLVEMSCLTWEQLRQAPRHGQGCEKISRSAIRSGIPACVTEDVNLIAFRFSGLAPVVGFRARRIFHILWLDRAFTLYKH